MKVSQQEGTFKENGLFYAITLLISVMVLIHKQFDLKLFNCSQNVWMVSTRMPSKRRLGNWKISYNTMHSKENLII